MPGKKKSLLLRFIKEGNEHYKSHAGGTIVTVLATVVPWVAVWAGLNVPAWIGAPVLLALLISIAASSAWFTATRKNLRYEDMLKPKIRTCCGPDVPGSKPALNRGVQALRIVVSSQSEAPIANCQAYLLEIVKDSKQIWGGNKAGLTFAPAERNGDQPKAIYPKTPDFIDLNRTRQP